MSENQPPVRGSKPPGQLLLKIVATLPDGRLVAWDESGGVWLLERQWVTRSVPGTLRFSTDAR